MLRDIRTNYDKFELLEKETDPNPVNQFNHWLKEAISGKVMEPTAMVLSTTDENGDPESRVVLLKEIREEGLIFFTNYESKKGRQILNNPKVSAVFFWPEYQRQVRIKGIAEKISDTESSDYFKSRPVDSQLGAWASPQSQVIENRETLDLNYKKYREFFQNNEIKKPPH